MDIFQCYRKTLPLHPTKPIIDLDVFIRFGFVGERGVLGGWVISLMSLAGSTSLAV
ncbi:hypothetical protein IMZ48_41195 [Candidatus Bathyarchaeota archaeon]|nr:hypothetical protein [Candidatus Bathyarchaeota archaeon]